MGFTKVADAGPIAQQLDTVRGIADRGSHTRSGTGTCNGLRGPRGGGLTAPHRTIRPARSTIWPGRQSREWALSCCDQHVNLLGRTQCSIGGAGGAGQLIRRYRSLESTPMRPVSSPRPEAMHRAR